MAEQHKDTGNRQRLLARQLLDFMRAPGRYAIRLGEPPSLFQEFETVVRWAHGRLPEELADAPEMLDAPALVRAAVLFIQRACFGRGCTHYQVLGLAPENCSAERLRAHYRMLIRLTHPDLGVRGLPANAAGMVNQAYDVLRDEAARQRYDQKLASWGDAPGLRPRRPATAAPPGDAAPTAPASTAPRTAHQIATRSSEALAFGLDRRPPWSERCTTWMAGYPRQFRSTLVAGCVVLLAGGVVAWITLETMESDNRVLVAALPDSTAETATAVVTVPSGISAQVPGAIVAATSIPGPAAHAGAVQATPGTPADAIPPAAGEGVAIAPAQPEPAGPMGVAPADADAGPPPRIASRRDTEPSAAGPAAPRTRLEPAAPHEARPAKPPTRVAQAAPRPTRADVARTTAGPAAHRTEAAPAEVDAHDARNYLEDIVAALRRGQETEQLNRYLAQMNVRGSLLTPVLERQLGAPHLTIRHTDWNEARRPGTLNLRAILMLEAPGAQTDISVYRLLADFRSTPQGTVLERLDLQHVR